MTAYNLIPLFVIPLFVLIGIILFVFWVLMLIDSLTRKFKDGTEKIAWVLVNIFVGVIGAFIYYFVIYKKDNKKSINWVWITLFIVVILTIIFIVLSLVFSEIF